MTNDSEEVLDRLQGKKLPVKCPKCGESLETIYSLEPVFWWNDISRRYGYSTELFGESPNYRCPDCLLELPQELIDKILEEIK